MSLTETVDISEGDILQSPDKVMYTVRRNRSAQEISSVLLSPPPWSPNRSPSPPASISSIDIACSTTSGLTPASSAIGTPCGDEEESLTNGFPDGDAVAMPSAAAATAAEAMTTSRSPEINAATLEDNKKKSEPALGTSQASPTLQIKRHSTENVSPSSLSPSQSPKLGGNRSPDIRLSPVAPLGGSSPSPTTSGTVPVFPDTPPTESASEVPAGLQQSASSLTDSHASLDRTSESSGRSQESGTTTAKATPDHQSSSSRQEGSALRGSDRSDKSDQMSRSYERSDRSDRSDKGDSCSKKGSDQGDKSAKLMEKKKKTSSWYNMLNPSYKSKSEDFKRLFKDLPETERLIVDYSCALQRDILVHGRLYVTQNFICFYANIFRWETNVVIRCRDITSMTKEKTARVIPNAVQVCTDHEKHFFTSFGARDKTYLMLFRIWQNALMEQPMSTQELWQWVHYSYGDELGLTSDDDDYVAPPYLEDDHKNNNSNRLPPPSLGEKSDITPGDLDVDEALVKMSCSAFEALSSEVNGLDDENSGDGDQLPALLRSSRENLAKTKHSDIPTDLSDTTESEAIEACEAPCPSPTHEGKEHLNIILPISVDQLFTLLFTGSRFFHDLLTSRKTYDVTESNWQPCPETGHKLRQVTYTITLNHAMAKAAQTTETQILLKQSKPGQVYAIDCDVLNAGIPYSDTFCVKSHYCLSKISDSQCRLRVYGCIRYKKSVWGLVKSVIEKNAMQGLADFCSDLEAALLRESDRLQPVSKKLKRRKRMKVLDVMSKLESTKELLHSSSSQTCFRKYTSAGSHANTLPYDFGSTNTILKGVLFLMIILLLVNLVLLYKLWWPDDKPQGRNLDVILFENTPSTNEEWTRLLTQREALHRLETEKWKATLMEITKLIRMIDSSLLDLKASLDTYHSYTSMPSTVDVSTKPPPPPPKNL
ncbi:protein Aster-B-like isoform X2 [Ornithodoros turicata]|uniref:protein Aster-B-like isoform X2 n=1 Tax=Ornithodoros turicata TaxID=34597 RepID=UPI003138F02F